MTDTMTGSSLSSQSRRQFLQRSAALTAAAWAAPGIMSVGAPAAAVTPDICPTTDSPPPTSLTFRYQPSGCTTDTCEASQPQECCGDPANTTVCVYSVFGSGTNAGTDCDTVSPGNTFTVGDGTKKMNPELTMTVYEGASCTDGTCDGNTEGGCPVTGDVDHFVRIHTSCSQGLCFGDDYGSFVLVSGTT